jgi:hypothetical protein
MKMSSKNEASTPQRRPGLLWDPAVDGRSTTAVPKESTSKEVEMAKEEPKIPEFDTDKVEALLNILLDLKDSTEYTNIRASTAMQLAAIDRELWEELYPEQAAAEKKRLEELEKAEEEAARQKEKAA